jgi:hypothetical protein
VAGLARRAGIGILAAVAVSAGCSGESAPPAPPPPRPAVPQDAGVDGVTVLPSMDPTSGMHLDEGPVQARVAPTRPKNRPARPIDVTLKSEPHGALAAVDGRPIGTTPTFWAGESDGLEHEFTFSLYGYASARYRFVPLTSGVLHVTLQPVAAEAPDAGLEPLIAPKIAPDAAAPVPVPVPPPAVAPPAPPAPGSGEPRRSEPGSSGIGPPP